ncbi:MAG: glycosylphosphatidylinositol anchor biosynthesis [Chrysothrix sp. TS-e1954]|nr:MAG: glycosylphosphatidylinositol anchor biosynthesis [Chrysothrix sp. TS-e1954]
MADGIATASTKQMAHDQTQNGAPLDSVMHPDVDTQRSRDVLIALIGLRLVNALTLATFFQPDEYYQALEPAWRMTFGGQSGAWITWEWDHQLRSAIYPSFISGLYHLANGTCWLLSGPPTLRTQLLILLPKVGHAGLAALTDYSAWQLGERLYGRRSRKSSAMVGRELVSLQRCLF